MDFNYGWLVIIAVVIYLIKDDRTTTNSNGETK